jgi:protein gp37
MADKTAIEWTDATWNPIRARNLKTGKVGWFCTHVTEGCANCYAEDWNMRLGTGLPYKPGHMKDIEIFLDEKTLGMPLRWTRPRKIFPCSMTDMFADFVKDEWIRRMVMVMADARQHTFQPLTKRPGRALAAFSQLPAPQNVWLGVSVEDQAAADERIPILQATRAAKRWLSCEPLLGPINLAPFGHVGNDRIVHDIDWVVAGGESGPRARPINPDWARSLRDQCALAGVPYLFKQWGEFVPTTEFRDGQPFMTRVGKKRAGRLLDGVEHNGYPT